MRGCVWSVEEDAECVCTGRRCRWKDSEDVRALKRERECAKERQKRCSGGGNLL